MEMTIKQRLSDCQGHSASEGSGLQDLAKVNLTASKFARDQGVNAPDRVNLGETRD